jgi:hypothetical protein
VTAVPSGGPISNEVPRLGGFYQNRRSGHIVQVIEWVPHRGVGYLVRIRNFHRQFPKTMTVNPKLFEKLFELVEL